jgi:hypothetical protein
MMKLKIQVYQFEELDDKATFYALSWLNEFPLEYEDELGDITYQYFDELYEDDASYVIDHCDANKYLFNKYGEPIHHLIVEA